MTEPRLLQDARTGSTARIAPHVGFNCYEFQAVLGGRTIDVLYAQDGFVAGDKRPTSSGIPLLFPYPNRIRDGRFAWDGREYEIPSDGVCTDPAGHPLHGFCLDRPWRIIDGGDDYVVGEFQLSRDAPDRTGFWPADFIITVRYAVQGTMLRCDVAIRNPDEKPLPWGFGTHPYFRVPLAADSNAGRCLVEAAAHEQWELVDCLPTGERKPVTSDADLREGAYCDRLQLDDVLTGLRPEDGAMQSLLMDESAGLQVLQRADPAFRELVVFTPPHREAVCLEPYTCVTDAVNLHQRGIDAGWRVLPPDEEFRTWIEIHAGPVMA